MNIVSGCTRPEVETLRRVSSSEGVLWLIRNDFRKRFKMDVTVKLTDDMTLDQMWKTVKKNDVSNISVRGGRRVFPRKLFSDLERVKLVTYRR